MHGMWSYSLIEVRHCRLFATVAFSRAARVQQNWKLAESSRSSSRRGHISLLSWTADFFLVHSDAQPFSKQLEINIVHGMWSYSLIEVRHCRLFATVAFSRAARVQQNWKLAESSRSSSRRGHISFLCFIDTLSYIPCNHGHSPSGSVTSGR